MNESTKDKDKEQVKTKKPWRERLLLHSSDRLLSTFDALMMIVIAYSCFLSAYYAAFEFPLHLPLCYWLENVCTFFFTTDIIFNFMRVPLSASADTDQKITHQMIGWKYVRGGKFFVDTIATLPLYLITYY